MFLLGVAVGGFIYHDGTLITRYPWGFGLMTNNHAKLRGLLLGMILAKYTNLPNIVIIGNSLITIQHLQKIHNQRKLYQDFASKSFKNLG